MCVKCARDVHFYHYFITILDLRLFWALGFPGADFYAFLFWLFGSPDRILAGILYGLWHFLEAFSMFLQVSK